MSDLRDILKNNDLIGEAITSTSLRNRPTKTEIDSVLIENGFELPLPAKVSFHMYDGDKMFIVTWFPIIGKYGYEKLTMKG